jgi:predicted GIY-YIG superfamily endonuclease
MWFVYILKSTTSDFIYIGSTNNQERRLKEHNEGKSQSIKASAAFEIEAYVAVKTESKARELEKYFKTGSGKAMSADFILIELSILQHLIV